MKGGRPKWHSDGIEDDGDDVVLDDAVYAVGDVFYVDEDAVFADVGVSRLLVTGCNFC